MHIQDLHIGELKLLDVPTNLFHSVSDVFKIVWTNLLLIVHLTVEWQPYYEFGDS